MSLTVALKAAYGLVMAADSRVTEGYTLEGPKVQDNSVKFIRLDRDWGVQTYGNSNIGSAGIGALRDRIEANASLAASQEGLLEECRAVFKRESEKWSRENPGNHRQDKDVGFVLAGYGKGSAEPVIVNFQSPGFLDENMRHGCLLAGQWHIARFFLQRLYIRDARLEKMKELAVLLLNATMKSEKTVGGAIRLAEITPEEGFRWATDEDVEALRKNSERLEGEFHELLHASLDGYPDAPAEDGLRKGPS
ncbi:MAG: hypothetical protein HY896_05385 [Deltaproteobacteria bacterium]|nr:hypothetical protein [Deltaproteobacteria bacterium]